MFSGMCALTERHGGRSLQFEIHNKKIPEALFFWDYYGEHGT
jgi:hypothetical protein